MYRILILEDDESFGYILSEYLTMRNFQTHWAKSGEQALEMIEHKAFDMAILDIMLPGVDGYEVAKKIKRNHPRMPFIFLSAKALKIDKLKGFKVGAYDYITKPVDEELLVAKIEAMLGQMNVSNQVAQKLQIGLYEFDHSLCKLYFESVETKLTSRESELLLLLCNHKNRLLPRKKALRQIWESTDEFSRKSMDVFISHLRKYLAQDPNIVIENVHGKGFVLKC